MSQSMADLDTFKMDDVIWIDLFSPSGDEKRATEKFLNTEIQSRARAEEIESSSRFSETETAIFANTNFLIPGPEEYSMEPVSFTLVENVLTTLRDVPLRSFTELQRKMQALPRLFPNGYWVFVSIMDQRVDLDADMIELMSKEIALYSRRVNQQEDINEAFLLDINQLQDNTMTVRENIFLGHELKRGVFFLDHASTLSSWSLVSMSFSRIFRLLSTIPISVSRGWSISRIPSSVLSTWTRTAS